MAEHDGDGAIVNMGSSMAGWDVLAGGSGYAASKHCVAGLTRIAALDAAPYGIRVNATCPGVIETRLGAPAADEAGLRRFADRIPLRRIGQPEDVAAAVAFLASDDARNVTRVDWLIDGGQTLQSWANAPEGPAYPKAGRIDRSRASRRGVQGTGYPLLLERLELRDALIAIEAMDCQRDIAQVSFDRLPQIAVP